MLNRFTLPNLQYMFITLAVMGYRSYPLLDSCSSRIIGKFIHFSNSRLCLRTLSRSSSSMSLHLLLTYFPRSQCASRQISLPAIPGYGFSCQVLAFPHHFPLRLQDILQNLLSELKFGASLFLISPYVARLHNLKYRGNSTQ